MCKRWWEWWRQLNSSLWPTRPTSVKIAGWAFKMSFPFLVSDEIEKPAGDIEINRLSTQQRFYYSYCLFFFHIPETSIHKIDVFFYKKYRIWTKKKKNRYALSVWADKLTPTSRNIIIKKMLLLIKRRGVRRRRVYIYRVWTK